jgi:hypothetical protein
MTLRRKTASCAISTTDGAEVSYRHGTPAEALRGTATLVFLDGGMFDAKTSAYELLDLRTTGEW